LTDSIGKNIISIYIANFGSALFTFLFWVISSNLTDSRVIGTVSAISAFAMILGVMSNFDIGVGMKRFLGKAIAGNELDRFKNIVSVSTSFTLVTSAGILLIAFNPFFNFLEYVGISQEFIPIIAIIVIGNNLQHIFIGALVSAKKSSRLILPSMIASFSRFPALFLFFYFIGETEVEIAWSYSILYLVSSIFLLFVTLRYLKSIKGSYFAKSNQYMRLVLRGSFPRWIPQVIVLLGTQLGTLVIFSVSGAAEAGLFYIPFAIMNVLFLASHAINQVIHPIFSGLEDIKIQKQYLFKTLKTAFFATMPFAAIMFFYAPSILSIFGKEFSQADETFSILLLGFPGALIADSVYFLLYARGNYRDVLSLGLIANVPRIMLYFILVPMYGGPGGAIAYVIGVYLQLILTIIIIERLKIRLPYIKLICISIIPFVIGYLVGFIEVEVFGALILLFASLLIFLKVKIINCEDVKNVQSLFSDSPKLSNTFQKIIDMLKRGHLM